MDLRWRFYNPILLHCVSACYYYIIYPPPREKIIYFIASRGENLSHSSQQTGHSVVIHYAPG